MTPLVLVHGFLGGSAQWDGLATALHDKRDLIAVDLPGFGANAHLKPLSSIYAYAGWVIQTLRDKGVGTYDLMGHSMGGMIVQEIARQDRANLKRLILYGTGAIGVLPGRFETIAESKRRAVADGAVATARRISATWLLENEASPLFSAVADLAQMASIDAIHAGLDAMESWSGIDNLTDISAETLVIWGDQDRTYTWAQTQQVWSSIQGAQLCVIPNCAHLVHLEAPLIFHEIMLRFLK